MPGYLVALDSVNSLRLYINRGAYSTKLSPPRNRWLTSHEGTFADYATMSPGDNIYFFIKRKIYGIGELVSVGDDCKYCNFPNSSEPRLFVYEEIRHLLLLDEGETSVGQRWVCFFRPAPCFFSLGIDMDDVLASKPSAFKMLRAFWKLSFIKFDDEENQAFLDIILKWNEENLGNEGLERSFPTEWADYHEAVRQNVANPGYPISAGPIVSAAAEGDGLRHEMALEGGLLWQLAAKDAATESIFGRWDYLSHQVIASPFKPVDYMDKIDVFGYRYIPDYKPTISRYLVIEMKKGVADDEAVDQLLKYVDWVNDEYAFGDYGTIEAYLLAYNFSENVIVHMGRVARRRYIIGRRPARSEEWVNCTAVTYTYNPENERLEFRKIT